jgi:hypothetical protein
MEDSPHMGFPGLDGGIIGSTGKRRRVGSNDVLRRPISNMVADKIGRIIRVVKMAKRSMCLDFNVGRATDVLRVSLEVAPETIPSSIAGDGSPLPKVSKAGKSCGTVRLHHHRKGRFVGGTASEVKSIVFPQKASLRSGSRKELGNDCIGAVKVGALH